LAVGLWSSAAWGDSQFPDVIDKAKDRILASGGGTKPVTFCRNFWVK
jgi:hypothetical protein